MSEPYSVQATVAAYSVRWNGGPEFRLIPIALKWDIGDPTVQLRFDRYVKPDEWSLERAFLRDALKRDAANPAESEDRTVQAWIEDTWMVLSMTVAAARYRSIYTVKVKAHLLLEFLNLTCEPPGDTNGVA